MAHQKAWIELAKLDEEIRTHPPGAAPGAPLERLEKLTASECFRILGGAWVPANTGLSLTTWWADGGHSFVAGALELAGSERTLWVAPDVRRALTLETAPGHPLASLLCAAHDPACGRDTDGWRLRAEAKLEQGARIRRFEGSGRWPKGWNGTAPPEVDDCDTFVRAAPPARRFQRYRACLSAAAVRRQAFPIGRLKQPTEGWLVLSGRRGHHSFCDELRAFDLASGAAYRVSSCADLALVPDGSVDHRATDDGRRLEMERGTVSRDAIREAAWMLLYLDEMDRKVLSYGFGLTLPRAISVEIPSGPVDFDSEGRGVGSSSSGDTRLVWRVWVGQRQLRAGSAIWPRAPNDDASAHATELLEIAESSFHSGCPAAKPPAELEKEISALSAHRLECDLASLAKAAADLKQAWRSLVKASCRTTQQSEP